jgi:hypothetical protein
MSNVVQKLEKLNQTMVSSKKEFHEHVEEFDKQEEELYHIRKEIIEEKPQPEDVNTKSIKEIMDLARLDLDMARAIQQGWVISKPIGESLDEEERLKQEQMNAMKDKIVGHDDASEDSYIEYAFDQQNGIQEQQQEEKQIQPSNDKYDIAPDGDPNKQYTVTLTKRPFNVILKKLTYGIGISDGGNGKILENSMLLSFKTGKKTVMCNNKDISIKDIANKLGEAELPVILTCQILWNPNEFKDSMGSVGGYMNATNRMGRYKIYSNKNMDWLAASQKQSLNLEEQLGIKKRDRDNKLPENQ